MAIATVDPTSSVMTAEEVLAMPENDAVRELIRGKLKEYPMPTRCLDHSRITAELTRILGNWCVAQQRPRGMVLNGDVRCRLRTDPDTLVGIDIAYISPEMAAAAPGNATYIDGPPVLAVEVLSPSDQHVDVAAKVREYLSAGVKLVWIVDPDFSTVVVHRPNEEPELRNRHQRLSGEPWLSGFDVAVAEIFD